MYVSICSIFKSGYITWNGKVKESGEYEGCGSSGLLNTNPRIVLYGLRKTSRSLCSCSSQDSSQAPLQCTL